MYSRYNQEILACSEMNSYSIIIMATNVDPSWIATSRGVSPSEFLKSKINNVIIVFDSSISGYYSNIKY